VDTAFRCYALGAVPRQPANRHAVSAPEIDVVVASTPSISRSQYARHIAGRYIGGVHERAIPARRGAVLRGTRVRTTAADKLRVIQASFMFPPVLIQSLCLPEVEIRGMAKRHCRTGCRPANVLKTRNRWNSLSAP